MHEIRTIDVWDTLLRRDCHPECIKLATARYLLLKFSDRIKPEFADQWALYQARIDAELLLAGEARQGGADDEYEIVRVLGAWLAAVGAGEFDVGLPRVLADYELATEIARTYADPGIVEFLENHPAKKTIFLSDFYMDAGRLQRLLNAHRLDQWISQGISSCDVNLNKRSGKLFSHVLSSLDIRADQQLHIGDNAWSDVESPAKLGIAALRYLPADEHEKRLQREHLFSSRDVLLAHIHEVCSAEALKVHQGEKNAEAFLLGVEATPLFAGFALWIAEQAVKNNLDKIVFFTREGEFFYQVYSSVFADGLFAGVKLPGSAVLPVSRVSTFAASLEGPGIEYVSRAWSLFGLQKVSALFTTLNLDVSAHSALLMELGMGVDEMIENPSADARMQALFANVDFLEAVSSSIARNRMVLKELLREHGVQDGMKIGVVDIGWRGTIQDNIALAFPSVDFYGMYLGLRSFVNKQPENVRKQAYGPDENVIGDLNRLFEVFAALEMMCSSPNGSVVGYQREAGAMRPVRDVSERENASYFEFSESLQKGVVFAARQWAPFLNAYVVSSDEIRGQAMKVWETFRHSPPASLAAIFLQTPQHDVFGFGEIFSRDNFPSLSTLLLSPFLRSKRSETLNFVRRVQWSAAVDKANDLGWVHRKMLHLFFVLANHLKIIRMRIRHSGKL